MATTIDADEFARIVAPYRHELLVHAYRLTGAPSDAEDALQEGMIAAWRGLSGLRERAALRAWLYRVTTNAALRLVERRGLRLLSWDSASAADPAAELGPPRDDVAWVEPFRGAADPAEVAERREHIELAWIAAVQQLPATQRAVLVLREVLGFSADETADLLDTSRTAVNSALQRARATLAGRRPSGHKQHAELDRDVVKTFVEAFTAGDVERVVELLADDVRFTMPPLPAWFDGRADVAEFLRTSVFATPWRVREIGMVNGHPAVLGEQRWEGAWRPGALMILHLREGRIGWLATFVGPLCTDWVKDFPTDR
ncbi:RNA polymerase subunit sigma-70 [Micropruina sp.]|uniref:RNA polymerase subunit sigma-70 n=1 Tax=Micropruina sp. TaxID=2737536 RepID=UPI0039E6AC81